MSGICGFVKNNGAKGPINDDDIKAMCMGLDVSSQNSDKNDVSQVTINNVLLGSKGFGDRLSGVLNENNVALAFYGNIYEQKDILNKEKLLKWIMSLYLKSGISFIEKLKGEFNLAIWDNKAKKLFVATDKFRIHPIFYYCDHDKLIFSSTIKSILASPFKIDRDVNLETIIDLVSFSIIPTPKTIFRKIKKLPPGFFLTYHQGNIEVKQYWDLSFKNPSLSSCNELIQETKRLFTSSIKSRIKPDMSFENVGSFLSGGIDSSTVTGVMTQVTEGPVNSFTIGFGEERFNEMSFARISANAFRSKHHEYYVTPQDTYNLIPTLIEAFDEPFANASAIPTYFCAKLALDNGVNTLFAGDGGDELFAGNERYASMRLFDYYQNIPAYLRNIIIEPMVFSIANLLDINFFIKGKKYIQRSNIPYPDRLTSYDFFTIISREELFHDDFLDSVGRDYKSNHFDRHYSNAIANNELDKQLYLDLKLAISDNDLFKVSRMTEAAGVTVRYPFLDDDFVEFALKVPAKLKMKGRDLRTFFKKAYSDILPSEVISKEKQGFGLPIPVWLKTDKQLNELMNELLLDSRCVNRGYFKKSMLEELIRRHKSDETSFYGTSLWNLMIIELWHRKYLDNL